MPLLEKRKDSKRAEVNKAENSKTMEKINVLTKRCIFKKKNQQIDTSVPRLMKKVRENGKELTIT